VRSAVDVEHLSGYLTRLCEGENSVGNVFYVRDFSDWLRFFRVHWILVCFRYAGHQEWGFPGAQVSDDSDGVHRCDQTRGIDTKQLDDGVDYTLVLAGGSETICPSFLLKLKCGEYERGTIENGCPFAELRGN
jgi:hypothetical protein